MSTRIGSAESRTVNPLLVMAAVVGVIGLGFGVDQVANADDGCGKCCVESTGNRCFFTNAEGERKVIAYCRTTGVKNCDITIKDDGSCTATAGCNPAQTEIL